MSGKGNGGWRGESPPGERGAHPAFKRRGGCSAHPPARSGASPKVASELLLPLLLFGDRGRKRTHSGVTACLSLPTPSFQSPPRHPLPPAHGSTAHVKCRAKTVLGKVPSPPPAPGMLRGKAALPCRAARAFSCLNTALTLFQQPSGRRSAEGRERRCFSSWRPGRSSQHLLETAATREGCKGSGPRPPPTASYRMSDRCCPVRRNPTGYQ